MIPSKWNHSLNYANDRSFHWTLDDDVPGVLTSFPALNGYHASIHGVNTDYRIHGSTPELASTIPTPCDATPIVLSTCSSPEERISDELNAKSRKSPEIEVPLVSKEDLSTRKSPTISSSLGSSDSYSAIRRYYMYFEIFVYMQHIYNLTPLKKWNHSLERRWN